MVRYSIFIYCDMNLSQLNEDYLKSKNRPKDEKDAKYDVHIKAAQAFYMFLEN